MGIVETLIASQRRPDAEALRIATAVKESIPTSSPGRDSDAAGAAAAWAAAANEAVEDVNYAIAEEKTPRRAAAAPAHLEQFMDTDTGSAMGFDDDSDVPVQSASHRRDPRFVLSDDEPSPLILDATAKFAPSEAVVPTVTAVSPPWRTDDTTGERDVVSASLDEIPAPPWVTDAPTSGAPDGGTESAAAPVTGGGPVGYAYDDPADPASVNSDGLPAFDDLGDDNAGEGYGDIPAAEASSGNDDIPAPGLTGDGPRTTARWERRQPAPSPWGEEPEVATPDVADPDDADERSVPIAPRAPHGVDNGEPEPSQYATAPPEDFDEPEPQPREPVLARLRRELSLRRVVPWFTGPRRALKIIGTIAGTVLLIAVIVASFITAGTRNTVPEPAGQVAAPPAGNDTPPPSEPRATPLVPATVSASCGNETDAVAPFSGDKTRAFVCRRINGLDLNVLNISFSCPVVITSVTVVPGFAYVAPDGRDEWVRHRLTTGISWRMGGSIYPQQIVPTRTGVTMNVPSVVTQQMSATITSSMRPPMGESATDDFGSKNDEAAKVDEYTAISKIVIHGYPVDPGSGLCGAGE